MQSKKYLIESQIHAGQYKNNQKFATKHYK